MKGKTVVSLIRSGDEASAVEAIRNCPSAVEFRDYSERSLLHFASRYGLVEACKLLLDLEADINATDKDFMTPLSRACSKGNVDVVEFLLCSGADPNKGEGRNLFAAFNCRCSNGLAIAKLLIEHEIEINRVFLMFDDPSNRKTILDFVEHDSEFHDLLFKHGARSASEIPAPAEPE